MLIPWTAFWDRNYFVEWSPTMGAFLTSNYTRGAVTGLGLLNVWAALAELGDAFLGNNPPSDRHDPQSSFRNPPSDFRNPQ